MRIPFRFLLPASLLALTCLSSQANAATCENENFENRVSGADQCLVMRRYGTTEPQTMVVWLHGDISSGGPATYHFAAAQRAAEELAADKVLSVALVRPAYDDGEGGTSSARIMAHSDHYTKVNMKEVATAIRRLRERFHPHAVILVGHSGGAATSANILGMFPDVANAAVLVACPCDIDKWRAMRMARPWSASESPIKWADRVDTKVHVIALTGDKDDNTDVSLAKEYVERLNQRGINAVFRPLAGQTHNGAFRTPDVMAAVKELVGFASAP